jgi:hypothetical protein
MILEAFCLLCVLTAHIDTVKKDSTIPEEPFLRQMSRN